MYRGQRGQPELEPEVLVDTCDDVRLFLADGFSTFASFVDFVLPTEDDTTRQEFECLPELFQDAARLLTTSDTLSKDFSQLMTYKRAFLQQVVMVPPPSEEPLIGAQPSSSAAPAHSPAGARPGTTQAGAAHAPLAELTLALLPPLLESQSAVDSALIKTTVQAMLNFLKSLSPQGLKGVPPTALLGLENLLIRWLSTERQVLDKVGVKLEDIAGAVVALSVARDDLNSYVDTLHLIVKSIDQAVNLPIGEYLEHFAQNQPRMLPSTFLQSHGWTYVNPLDSTNTRVLKHPKHRHSLQLATRDAGWNCDGTCGHKSSKTPFILPRYRCTAGCDYDLCQYCVASVHCRGNSIVAKDGYLYVTDSNKPGIFKLGTGARGTASAQTKQVIKDSFRGYLTFCEELLLFFRVSNHRKGCLADVYDRVSLKSIGSVIRPKDVSSEEDGQRRRHILHVASTDSHVYRVSLADSSKAPDVVVEEFALCVDEFEPQRVECVIKKGCIVFGSDLYKGVPNCGPVVTQAANSIKAATGDELLSIDGQRVRDVAHADSLLQDNQPHRAAFMHRSVPSRLVRRFTLKPPADAAAAASVSDHVLSAIFGAAGSGPNARSWPSESMFERLPCGLPRLFLTTGTFLITYDSIILYKVLFPTRETLGFGHRPDLLHDVGRVVSYVFDLSTGELRAEPPYPALPVGPGSPLYRTKHAQLLACLGKDVDCTWTLCSDRVDCWRNTSLPLTFNLDASPSFVVDLLRTSECHISAVKRVFCQSVCASSQQQPQSGGGGSKADIAGTTLPRLVDLMEHFLEQEDHACLVFILLSLAHLTVEASAEDLGADVLGKLKALLLRCILVDRQDVVHAATSVLSASVILFYPKYEDIATLLQELVLPSSLPMHVRNNLRMDALGLIEHVPATQLPRSLVDLLLQAMDEVQQQVSAAMVGVTKHGVHDHMAVPDASVWGMTLIKYLCNDTLESDAPPPPPAHRDDEEHQQGDSTSHSPGLAHKHGEANDEAKASTYTWEELHRKVVLRTTDVVVRIATEGKDLLSDVLRKYRRLAMPSRSSTAHRQQQQQQQQQEQQPGSHVQTQDPQQQRQQEQGQQQGGQGFASHISSASPQDSNQGSPATTRRRGGAAAVPMDETKARSLDAAAKAIIELVRGSAGMLTSLVLLVTDEPEQYDEEMLQRLRTVSLRFHAFLNLTPEVDSSGNVPKPWEEQVVVESPHPIPEGYRFTKTVSVPGAQGLTLQFDPRCTSQYDYDKLIISAGSSPRRPHIGAYGGNHLGYGGGTSSWPHQLVRVPGNTVTLHFEMKSARESQTPPEAMWGFHVTITPQGAPEKQGKTMGLLAEVQLALLNRICSIAETLFFMPPLEPMEDHVLGLLPPNLVKSIPWSDLSQGGDPADMDTAADEPAASAQPGQPAGASEPPAVSATAPRGDAASRWLTKLKQDSADRMLSLDDARALRTRFGSTDLLRLPRRMLAAVRTSEVDQHLLTLLLNQVGARQDVHRLLQGTMDDYLRWLADFVRKCFQRINTFLRRLMALANMEQQWVFALESAVEEGAVTELFFSHWQHEVESQHPHLKNLQDLGLLFCPKLKGAEPDALVEALTAEFKRQFQDHMGPTRSTHKGDQEKPGDGEEAEADAASAAAADQQERVQAQTQGGHGGHGGHEEDEAAAERPGDGDSDDNDDEDVEADRASSRSQSQDRSGSATAPMSRQTSHSVTPHGNNGPGNNGSVSSGIEGEPGGGDDDNGDGGEDEGNGTAAGGVSSAGPLASEPPTTATAKREVDLTLQRTATFSAAVLSRCEVLAALRTSQDMDITHALETQLVTDTEAMGMPDLERLPSHASPAMVAGSGLQSPLSRSMSITAPVAVSRTTSAVTVELPTTSTTPEEELFQFAFGGVFAGSQPLRGEDVLRAVLLHQERARHRITALKSLIAVLKEHVHSASSARDVSLRYLFQRLVALLQQTHHTRDLQLSGQTHEYTEQFGQLLKPMTTLLAKAASNFKAALGLAVLPYQPEDVRVLINSGFMDTVHLLCRAARNKGVSSRAWAAFKVVACRCVGWDISAAARVAASAAVSAAPDSYATTSTGAEQLFQVLARFLVNHFSHVVQALRRAKDVQPDDVRVASVKEVLHLLDELADSHLGHAVLSHSSSSCALLSLMLSPVCTPRILDVVVRVLAVALPLLQVDEHLVEHLRGMGHDNVTPESARSVIVRILLQRLGDYATPPSLHTGMAAASPATQKKAVSRTGSSSGAIPAASATVTTPGSEARAEPESPVTPPQAVRPGFDDSTAELAGLSMLSATPATPEDVASTGDDSRRSNEAATPVQHGRGPSSMSVETGSRYSGTSSVYEDLTAGLRESGEDEDARAIVHALMHELGGPGAEADGAGNDHDDDDSDDDDDDDDDGSDLGDGTGEGGEEEEEEEDMDVIGSAEMGEDEDEDEINDYEDEDEMAFEAMADEEGFDDEDDAEAMVLQGELEAHRHFAERPGHLPYARGGREETPEHIARLRAALRARQRRDRPRFAHHNLDDMLFGGSGGGDGNAGGDGDGAPAGLRRRARGLHHYARLADAGLVASSGRDGDAAGDYVVRIHRRESQSARDVLAPLFSMHPRPFQHSDSLEVAMSMDHELTANKSAVITRGRYGLCLRRAMEWASAGVTVSVERDGSSKAAAVQVAHAEDRACHARNTQILQSRPPPRTFLTGAVADECAHKIVSLVHSLVSDSNTTRAWEPAVQAALRDIVEQVPDIVPHLACVSGHRLSPQTLRNATRVVGALCVLGGFREDVHVGARVLVGGSGLSPVVGVVESFERHQSDVLVRFSDGRKLKVPLQYVQSQYEEPPRAIQGMVGSSFVRCLEALLMQGANEPVGQQAPEGVEVAGAAHAVAASHRLLAELRTRACMALGARLNSVGSARELVEGGGRALGTVIKLATEAQSVAGEPLAVIVKQCSELRRTFFEKDRPSIHSAAKGGSAPPTLLHWDVHQRFPEIGNLVFMSDNTAFRTVPARNTPADAQRNRPTTVFANSAIPSGCECFYFEVRLAGTKRRDSDGPLIEVGMAPLPTENTQTWKPGAVLLDSTGKIHYQRSSSSSHEYSTDLSFSVGDTIGCAWQGEGSSIQFTHNGRLLPRRVQGLPNNSVPVVRVFGADTQVEANFGLSKFMFEPESLLARGASAESDEPEAEHSSLFGLSPFGFSEEESAGLTTTPKHQVASEPVLVADEDRLPYHAHAEVLSSVHTTMIGSTTVGVGEEEEEEEDLTEKLVKAWEKEVFPKISSRFRNSGERRSGFEQIRGALQMGMADIARMTVEGLYEESGGVPPDFNFPTLEDMKQEVSKVETKELKPGMKVRILPNSERHGFEVEGMRQTRGLCGTVVSVDNSVDLAQVDVYVPQEARLMHWWYPTSELERADGEDELEAISLEVHRRLLLAESQLTRLYCRSAVVRLIEHALLGQELVQRDLALRLRALEELRPSMPALCYLRRSSVRAFFQHMESTDDSAHLSPDLRHKLEALTADKDVFSRVCSPVLDASKAHGVRGDGDEDEAGAEFRVCRLPVEVGRKTFDVSFDSTCAVVVTVEPKDSDSAVLASPPSVQEGPWARFYVGSSGTGAQFAVYPATQTCMRTPLPYLLFSSSRRLHVRTTAQDVHPNAKLVVHSVPEKLPLALATLHACFTTTGGSENNTSRQSGFGAEMQASILQGLMNLAVRYDLGPALMELLLGTLSVALRAVPQQALDKADVGPRFHALFQGLEKLYDKRNTALNACTHTTLFQVLLQVVVDACTRFGGRFVITGKKEAISPFTKEGGTIGGSPGKGLPTPPGKASDAPVAVSLPSGSKVSFATRSGGGGGGGGSGGPSSSSRSRRRVKRGAAAARATSPGKASSSSSSLASAGSRPRASGAGASAPFRASAMAQVKAMEDLSEGPEWLCTVRRLRAAMVALTDDGSRCPRPLFERAWKAAYRGYQALARFVVVGALPTSVSAEELRTAVGRASRASGGFRNSFVRVMTYPPPSSSSSSPSPSDGSNKGASPKQQLRGAVLELWEAQDVRKCVKRLRQDELLSQHGAEVEPLETVLNQFAVMETESGGGSGETVPPLAPLCKQFLRRQYLTEAGELQPAFERALLSLMVADTDVMSAKTTHKGVPIAGILNASSFEFDTSLTVGTSSVLRTFFLNAGDGAKKDLASLLKRHSAADGGEGKHFRPVHLVAYAKEKIEADVVALVHAMASVGFDLHHARFRDVAKCMAFDNMCQAQWTAAADLELCRLMWERSRACGCHPTELTAPALCVESERGLEYSTLSHHSQKLVTLRAAMLQELNRLVSESLPMIDLRGPAEEGSLAWHLLQCRELVFHSVYRQWIGSVVDDTAARVDLSKGPELVLDPLETVRDEDEAAAATATGTGAGAGAGAGEERRRRRQHRSHRQHQAHLHEQQHREQQGEQQQHGDQQRGQQPQPQQQQQQQQQHQQQQQQQQEDQAGESEARQQQTVSPSGVRVPQFLQASEQVDAINPVDLRVKLAKGGDPIFPLVVRLTGERVAGTSGSYRELMLRMTHELQSGAVPLFVVCPSSSMGRNVGKVLLRTSAPTYQQRHSLRFLGMLFAMSIRSDVPMPLEALPCFWKVLAGVRLGEDDVHAAHKSVGDTIRGMRGCTAAEEFTRLAEDEGWTYCVRTIANQVVDLRPPAAALKRAQASGPRKPLRRGHPLEGHSVAGGSEVPGQQQQQQQQKEPAEAGAASAQDAPGGGVLGRHVPVTFEDREDYVRQALEFKLEELQCSAHVAAIREGFSTVLPLEVMLAQSWQSLELSVCGVADVDFEFLKRHTTYTSGLCDTDRHIVYFWRALESLSQADLRKFVKFACNQERIPSPYPDMSGDTMIHIPPYPMKIAPPDDSRFGSSDHQLIRAETCLFMVKLPQYSSQEIMTERLKQAISCRDDPLSG